MPVPQITAVLVGCAFVMTVLVGCGDEERVPEAQPSRWDTFTEGRHDDIPLMPLSDAVSELEEKDDVTVQSFEVRNRTPAQVMEFYEESLDDWLMTRTPEQLGPGTFRGTWRDEGYQLTVSSSAAPTLSEDSEMSCQYSLSLVAMTSSER